jgi:hypothetical protein
LKFNREKDTQNHDALFIWVQVAIALGLALMETAWLPCAIIGATESQRSIPLSSAAPRIISSVSTRDLRQQRIKTLILLAQSGSISQKQVTGRGCLTRW